ncbi:hypothetical protein DAEQUDRAFT_583243 [Daedalea quercina L-15889]|uniref:Uncharacterized protein n=1 Tax=Daedalea quercina L-15889 TaxID=1314783 RepID=A0A165LS09_9APHY|nr:hypothetical protein DAEQUDRAFT_583243 [Daedalea quercina L-15889]
MQIPDNALLIWGRSNTAEFLKAYDKNESERTGFVDELPLTVSIFENSFTQTFNNAIFQTAYGNTLADERVPRLERREASTASSLGQCVMTSLEKMGTERQVIIATGRQTSSTRYPPHASTSSTPRATASSTPCASASSTPHASASPLPHVSTSSTPLASSTGSAQNVYLGNVPITILDITERSRAQSKVPKFESSMRVMYCDELIEVMFEEKKDPSSLCGALWVDDKLRVPEITAQFFLFPKEKLEDLRSAAADPVMKYDGQLLAKHFRDKGMGTYILLRYEQGSEALQVLERFEPLLRFCVKFIRVQQARAENIAVHFMGTDDEQQAFTSKTMGDLLKLAMGVSGVSAENTMQSLGMRIVQTCMTLAAEASLAERRGNDKERMSPPLIAVDPCDEDVDTENMDGIMELFRSEVEALKGSAADRRDLKRKRLHNASKTGVLHIPEYVSLTEKEQSLDM